MADVPLFRPVMGRVATLLASNYWKRPVRVFFDSVWMRQDGIIAVPLEPDFWSRLSAIKAWKPNAADKVDAVGEWWFLHYTPKPNDIVLDFASLKHRLIPRRGSAITFTQ